MVGTGRGQYPNNRAYRVRRPGQATGLWEAILARVRTDHVEAAGLGTRPYIHGLFGYQVEFFEDPAKEKAALCGRRAGKSHMISCWLLDGAERSPGTISPLIAITRGHAKRIYWHVFEKLNQDYNLGLHFDRSELYITLPNHSVIWLAGCEDHSECEKFRGPPYRRVAIDEGASFRHHLEYLVEEVLEPALLDYDGELAIVGSPGAVPKGYFHAITTGEDYDIKQWPTHSWTCLDNPFVPRAPEFLEYKRERKGWDENHPTYQREWMGKWVRDDSALVYRFNTGNIGEFPGEERGWRYVLAIDLGASADKRTTGFSVLAYRKDSFLVWVVESFTTSGMIPSSVAERIRALDTKYGGFESIVADAGALGKGYVEEFRQRHSLPVKPAEKQNKVGYIELLNGDLVSHKLKVNEKMCQDLLEEWRDLPWNEDRDKPDDRFADHASDATLYGWRECKGFLAREPYDGPEETEQEKIVRLQRERVLGNTDDSVWWKKAPRRFRMKLRRRR